MKNIAFFITFCFSLAINKLPAQSVSLDTNKLEAVHVSMWFEKLAGKKVVKVVKDSAVKAFDEPTFVKIKEVEFKNGVIEVKVLSRLIKNAPEFARGFIGVAFRVNDSNTKYESIYIRPVNARVDDQLRRNHSIQYYAYPNYKFDRLRKESPEQYEAYADMEMDTWINMRIEVQGQQAKLFLNKNKQPSLVVNDLKHGADLSGGIGLWVDVGTEGYFTDVKISAN